MWCRVVVEDGGDVWNIGEFTLPVANRRLGRAGFDYFRWRTRLPHRGIRSVGIACILFKDTSFPWGAKINHKINFSIILVLNVIIHFIFKFIFIVINSPFFLRTSYPRTPPVAFPLCSSKKSTTNNIPWYGYRVHHGNHIQIYVRTGNTGNCNSRNQHHKLFTYFELAKIN